MARKKKDRKDKSGDLSHEEIWDDSALVRSWDDAVEEYNLYHSIHARGEDVDEVLNRAEREGADVAAGIDIEKDDESMGIEDDAGKAAKLEEQDITADEPSPSNVRNAVPLTAGPGGAPSVPDALLGQVQDPALKNLMMAWYFAGYYTGLYEGQRQAAPNGNPANQQ
ncbi:hypothetical protein UA08_05729 [Talaromyces atroroseus]|uniref:Survival Motor Neuron Gemin2-binding domain-containing protein n=1 Tax=Talaromyces atroroseus TaxID=1441469 RepID=A0A225ALQ4_TALAT|nr:hypothetical protein UA08_05729 [Talaromyces atroroseus]OKL59244.1 hypothetical protein UA08_05729 [Talaromyces atroroseus]